MSPPTFARPPAPAASALVLLAALLMVSWGVSAAPMVPRGASFSVDVPEGWGLEQPEEGLFFVRPPGAGRAAVMGLVVDADRFEAATAEALTWAQAQGGEAPRMEEAVPGGWDRLPGVRARGAAGPLQVELQLRATPDHRRLVVVAVHDPADAPALAAGVRAALAGLDTAVGGAEAARGRRHLWPEAGISLPVPEGWDVQADGGDRRFTRPGLGVTVHLRLLPRAEAEAARAALLQGPAAPLELGAPTSVQSLTFGPYAGRAQQAPARWGGDPAVYVAFSVAVGPDVELVGATLARGRKTLKQALDEAARLLDGIRPVAVGAGSVGPVPLPVPGWSLHPGATWAVERGDGGALRLRSDLDGARVGVLPLPGGGADPGLGIGRGLLSADGEAWTWEAPVDLELAGAPATAQQGRAEGPALRRAGVWVVDPPGPGPMLVIAGEGGLADGGWARVETLVSTLEATSVAPALQDLLRD
jgi:hypothetical protein